jgi:hypothetical protein
MLLINAELEKIDDTMVSHLFGYGYSMSSRLEDKINTTEKKLDRYDKEMIDDGNNDDEASDEL